MKLIATKAFGYGGVQLSPDQTFECSEVHAKALIALQKAKVFTAPVKPARVIEKAQEPAPAVEPSQDPARDAADAAKRAYQRRDMKAQ